ncbi:hypothetical protein OIDMADRAFT_16725, partial [Oidiodendron maius Zn]
MAYAPYRIVVASEKAVGEPWVNGLRGRTMRSLLQEKDLERMYEMIDLRALRYPPRFGLWPGGVGV